MRRFRSTKVLFSIFLMFFTFSVSAQDSFYGLKSIKKIATTPSKDLQRQGSCWSNAGAAFLEAEMLKNGKKNIDLAEMDFIHNAYLQKAEVYLQKMGKIRVGEDGLASDVIKSMTQFGFVPEDGYMKSDKDPFSEDTGEMDAILRGTLMVVLEKENGDFNERWRNTYNVALSSYIGEAMINFKNNNEDFTPKSFADKSGLNADDYVLISSDSREELYKSFFLPVQSNWSDERAFNVAPDDLTKVMKTAVEKGFTVVWYGDLVQKMIFAKENIALVPEGKMPVEKTSETDKAVMEPVAEKVISASARQEKFQSILNSNLDYKLVFGLNKDKKGTDYLLAKNTCKSGDEVLNLSDAYVKLNTVFLLLNKNALPADLKTKLGL